MLWRDRGAAYCQAAAGQEPLRPPRVRLLATADQACVSQAARLDAHLLSRLGILHHNKAARLVHQCALGRAVQLWRCGRVAAYA